MLRDKILELFREYDPEVQAVIERVLDKEWERLSLRSPRGIIQDIRDIIDSEVRRNET